MVSAHAHWGMTSKLVKGLLRGVLVISQLCVVWVVSQYGTLVVTVAVVVSGAHVAVLTVAQFWLFLVHVNMALCWLCSICTFGSKLLLQCFIFAEHNPSTRYVHVCTCRFHLTIHTCQLLHSHEGNNQHYRLRKSRVAWASVKGAAQDCLRVTRLSQGLHVHGV